MENGPTLEISRTAKNKCKGGLTTVKQFSLKTSALSSTSFFTVWSKVTFIQP